VDLRQINARGRETVLSRRYRAARFPAMGPFETKALPYSRAFSFERSAASSHERDYSGLSALDMLHSPLDLESNPPEPKGRRPCADPLRRGRFLHERKSPTYPE
jgi:hypothetical protein